MKTQSSLFVISLMLFMGCGGTEDDTLFMEEGAIDPTTGTLAEDAERLLQGDLDPNASKVPYNVYYGLLHSHTSTSDGSGSPAKAYQYARDTAKLDFFSIADHDYYPNDMTNSDWTTIKNAANSANSDGTFVAFWGFEWTSDSSAWQPNGLELGHVAIINSTDFCISSYEPTRTMNQLATWLSTRDVVAFFNHPGEYGTTFSGFSFNVTEKIVGMELWNRDADFSYYYNNGYNNSDGGLGYYDEAIQRGFYIGASGSDDNHGANWGATNDARLAVLATAKTRADIFEALKARRFYSTLDKNLVLSFTCNGQPMGSKIAGGSLNFAIDASDGNGESFNRIRLLKKGTIVKEWSPGAANPSVTFTQTGAKGDYFYVTVQQADGNEAISSPIFITSDGVANNPPVAQGQSVTTSKDTQKSIVLSATDVDGDSLTYTVASNPAQGTLSGTAPNVTYTPSLGYTGADSFTFKANDGKADSNVATVQITVVGGNSNNPPVAQNQSVTTSKDTAKSIVLSATDADGDSLTYTVASNPAHGTLSGTAPNMVYTPSAGYIGSDSFTFKANDGKADSNVATVQITVVDGNSNNPPVAQNQSVTTSKDTAKSIVLSATDADGDNLTYTVASDPAHGALSGTAPNMVYTPSAGYIGSDSFTYKANDGKADSNVATVQISVTSDGEPDGGDGDFLGGCAHASGSGSGSALIWIALLGLAIHGRRRSRRSNQKAVSR